MRVLLGASLRRNEKFYRLALENAGYVVTTEGPSQQSVNDTVVALMTSGDVVSQLSELRKQSARVLPVLIGDSTSFIDSPDLTLASAPTLPMEASVDELLRSIEFVSRGDGWLLRELLRVDKHAKQILGDDVCEWVRSRHGIIGILRFACMESTGHLTSLLRRSIEHAYTLLDNLPRQQFSVQDVWNVTLMIAVPIKEAERKRDPDLNRSLDEISRDLNGARKIVLCLDEEIRDYFGPLSLGHDLSKLSGMDPLRETLARLATDSKERDALEVIFKSRLSQEDIDQLMLVLGRLS
jgi:hypothetical protein